MIVNINVDGQQLHGVTDLAGLDMLKMAHSADRAVLACCEKRSASTICCRTNTTHQ